MTDRPCPPNIAPEIWAELCAAKDAIRARKEAKDKAAFGNGAAGEEWPDKEDIPIDDSPRRPKGKVEKKQPQANRLIELAADAQLFHAPDSVCFADIGIDGHRETWAIRSKGFRRWLVQRYFEEEEGAPNSDAVQTALGALEAKAQFKSPLRQVWIRIGAFNDRIYLDLCDEEWRSVEIGPGGWHIVQSPPVRFRRPAGMQPLPEPQRGGSIETLRSFLNVNPDGFTLGVAWILAALRDRGPYPILALAGEHGSAKSTFSAILRSLIDPNIAPLRALPREDRDLFIAATNGHLLCFDNVSGLPAWISDTLCRLATGGGFAVRQLYTDQDEVLFDACRPAILNGIEDIVTRPDLADICRPIPIGVAELQLESGTVLQVGF